MSTHISIYLDSFSRKHPIQIYDDNVTKIIMGYNIYNLGHVKGVK